MTTLVEASVEKMKTIATDHSHHCFLQSCEDYILHINSPSRFLSTFLS